MVCPGKGKGMGRKQETGNRKQETRNRKQDTGNPPFYSPPHALDDALPAYASCPGLAHRFDRVHMRKPH
ncbi:hypothetical protein VDGE_30581 [Verticillium dahliae]|uniref:Uncharacterized protein n=1 Tax=Verticillium dahliae TaxID=27337 RepID=A0A444RZD7_VERDA|nr:hypothetical protein VDGE_30581 [Verticillium dahliae]